MWTTVLLCWLLAASLHNWEYRKQTWFFFGLILASASLDTSGRAYGDPSRGPADALPPPDPAGVTAGGHA
jgi:hypothetical protein